MASSLLNWPLSPPLAYVKFQFKITRRSRKAQELMTNIQILPRFTVATYVRRCRGAVHKSVKLIEWYQTRWRTQMVLLRPSSFVYLSIKRGSNAGTAPFYGLSFGRFGIFLASHMRFRELYFSDLAWLMLCFFLFFCLVSKSPVPILPWRFKLRVCLSELLNIEYTCIQMYTWARAISYCRELEFFLWNGFNVLGQKNKALEGASLAANAYPQNMTCFSKHIHDSPLGWISSAS